MSNPFLIKGPAVIKFSGGRTSAYMLRMILDAHSGTLPSDVVTIFNNTGKERLETLDFVERLSQRWNVPVVWLEYCTKRVKWGRQKWLHTFKVVDYATASRNGEPFNMLIEACSSLPNQHQRKCTGELKVRATDRYVHEVLHWNDYDVVLGLRYDEPRRVANALAGIATEQTLFGEREYKTDKNGDEIEGGVPVCPLHQARITKEEINRFWQAERAGMPLEEWLALPRADRPGFDLELLPDHGNCDLCFLKGVKKTVAIMADRPDLTQWWIAKEETPLGTEQKLHTFRKGGKTYRELLVLSQSRKSCNDPDDDNIPCHCTD